MATLVLTAVGTAVGGPIGGAIGGLIGRQVDGAVFGQSGQEGPRLKELSVTTSSYGQPIPRIFGKMRISGTVIWATDLVETTQKEGGGKGKPSTTTYSYSASFAVALSSSPIARVGRIWADGNLLRGASGDLKVEGAMRTYLGTGDARADPLIFADMGPASPAFRDCAYVVFENLQLGDFGNRIPALTFEVIASEDAQIPLADLLPSSVAGSDDTLDFALGISDQGGPLISTLSTLDQVYPIALSIDGGRVQLTSRARVPTEPPLLPKEFVSLDISEGQERFRRRAPANVREPLSLRYYDEQRDYQPGIQSADGRKLSGRTRTVDLPVTMTSSGAKQLVNENAGREKWRREQLLWRINTLDSNTKAGDIVRVPDLEGYWRIESLEWLDRGIELVLDLVPPSGFSPSLGDAGAIVPPIDLPVPQSELRVFELPSNGSIGADPQVIYAALSASSRVWSGAAIFVEEDATLKPIGTSASNRATMGILQQSIGPSAGVLFEPNARLDVSLSAFDLGFESTDLAGIANGKNRLFVGGEVLQFLSATSLGDGQWALIGLLRGRGGTEEFAISGHPAGTEAILINEEIIALEFDNAIAGEAARFAAIGRGDPDPVFAAVLSPGLSRRPIPPVHPRIDISTSNTRKFCWTRRARGQWRWDTLFEVPLAEQEERYEIGFGPVENPFALWSTTSPSFTLGETELSNLAAVHGGGDLWVRQIGTYSASPPCLLMSL